MTDFEGTISNSELAILGLIAESPKHGYQIELDIQARGMREWTEIAFSSIYHLLNKLEAAGWLASTRQESSDRPPRKVYMLTSTGRAVYTQGVLLRLRGPRPNSADFALALANLGSLPSAAVTPALRQHQAMLSQRLERIQTKHAADQQMKPYFPWFVNVLFEYSETLVITEMEFINRILTQVPEDQLQEKTNE
jgi:DNA-binding PadR family transcriptional regulator